VLEYLRTFAFRARNGDADAFTCRELTVADHRASTSVRPPINQKKATEIRADHSEGGRLAVEVAPNRT
jgi:hypothetical protein